MIETTQLVGIVDGWRTPAIERGVACRTKCSLRVPPVDIHAGGHQPYWLGAGIGESRSNQFHRHEPNSAP
ncbi:hypothetical protein SAMN05216338_104059 [Bradyrhizobium sp. Rc2d]|nr:hypothetical protein SAMN05216338_104059 [Bradyrhizobium sp. Rc2d]